MNGIDLSLMLDDDLWEYQSKIEDKIESLEFDIAHGQDMNLPIAIVWALETDLSDISKELYRVQCEQTVRDLEREGKR